MSSALVVGEALVDIVRGAASGEHPGGSPANVAVALARLQRDVRLATSFADDRLGEVLSVHLEGAGVRLAGDPRILERTSSAVATIGEGGAASYEFDLRWEVERPDVGDAVVLHTGSLAAVMAPGADVIADLVAEERERVSITYDLNARPAATGTGSDIQDRAERLMRLADVVKASDEDLAATWPGLSTTEAAERVRELGATAVVVTEGAAGAFALTPVGEIRVPARAVEVADTIGAGDSFCAAMIDGLWSAGVLGADNRDRLAGLDLAGWEAVLERCARAAAIAVSRPGADPASLAELDG